MCFFPECILIFVCFSPECNAAGREGGPEEPAQTTGNSKLQPAGSDSGRAETDCIFTGEQYDTTDAECQTAGNPRHVIIRKTFSPSQISVIQFSFPSRSISSCSITSFNLHQQLKIKLSCFFLISKKLSRFYYCPFYLLCIK